MRSRVRSARARGVPEAASARLPRLDAITGLRWWAAFAVFLFHLRNLVPLPMPLADVAQFGYLGVTFFFVLSGFVLTWSWRAEVDRRTFWWRRFSRIYPLSVVTLLIALPVFYSFTPDPALPWVRPVDVGVLLLCLLLLQGWWRDPAILLAGNPASWTLTIEVFFYATHPFLMGGLRRLTRNGALLAALGVVAVAFLQKLGTLADPGGALAMLPPPVQRLNEFVLGMCLAWAFRRGWIPRLPVVLPLALMAAWFTVVAVSHRAKGGEAVYGIVSLYSDQVTTVLCGLLILTVASLELRGRTKAMRWRPIVALGEWSYAFYLVHATVIYAAIALFGRQTGGWRSAVLWAAIVLTVSLVLAWALHVGVERPLERRLRAWQENRRRAAAQRAVLARSSATTRSAARPSP